MSRFICLTFSVGLAVAAAHYYLGSDVLWGTIGLVGALTWAFNLGCEVNER